MISCILGPMVIIWKKTDEHGGSEEYLATGRTKLSVNPRIRMENVNDQGSTLAIDFVTADDVGHYVCEISSNPPATLRHQVSLLGILNSYLPPINKMMLL